MKRRLGYLCGAPRVSTRDDAEASGPRTHVLGVIGAFEALGYRVERFLAGDRISRRVSGGGSERWLRGGGLRTLAADLVRLALGPWNAWRAWRELGAHVDWVYERHSAFQSLGGIFQRHGRRWVLETNAPLFLEAHGDRRSLVLRGVARRLELRAYRRCDVLVCVSERLKQILVDELGVAAEKVVVVPNAVDTRVHDPARVTPRRVFAGLTLGFVGALYAWQALDVLLDAVAALREEGTALHVVVVGDGPCRGAWEERSKQLGLTGQVAFLGALPASEAAAWVAGFDVGFCGHADRQLGRTLYVSPLKLYEYMAMGVPVIASGHEDARRVVREEETGWVFRPGDVRDLQRALSDAWLARDELREMGRRARRQVEAHHTWTRRVEQLLAELEARLG